jgi:hypothetical protein
MAKNKKEETGEGNTAVVEAPKTTTTAKPDRVVTTVTMKDGSGRVVEFAGKRRMVKTSGTIDGQLGTRIDFINGESRFYPLPATLLEKAALHGWEQKFGDEVAGEKDVDDMVEAMDDLGKRLCDASGPDAWNSAREAGDGFSGASLILKAMCEVSGKTKEEVKASIEAKLATTNPDGSKVSRQALYTALKKSEKYGPTYQRLEAEKAAKGPQVEVGDL